MGCEIMKEKNKNMLKTFGTGMILGGVIAGGGVYASTVGASSVSYSNSSSGLATTNVQGALDETYKKALYREYYDQCHTVSINTKSYFNATTSTAISETAVVIDVNHMGAWAMAKGGSASATSVTKEYNTKVTACCNTKCSSTTNECYTKCNSGYSPADNDYIYKLC